jgi:chromate transport protein ChrA
MSVIDIVTLIYFIRPSPVWIIILAGIIGLILLEIKERNDKNGEKIKGKKAL